MEKTEKLTLRECLIGDRAFYRHVLVVVLPIIVQNTLTNVVSLLDNVMVGQVGTLPMSGVAVVGQLLFVYNLAVWGSTAGAGIFGAQFYGRGDMEGVRHTFRFKLLVALAITAAAIGLFLAAGPSLIGAYIAADTSPTDAAATLQYAEGYLRIMLVGLVPFGLTQCYAGTLRESGQTVLPMKASMLAMVVNFIFNALLIFGIGPFPRHRHGAVPLCGAGYRGGGCPPQQRPLPLPAGHLQQLCDPRRAGAGHPDPLHAAAGQRADVGCRAGCAAAVLLGARHSGSGRAEHLQHHRPDLQ